MIDKLRRSRVELGRADLYLRMRPDVVGLAVKDSGLCLSGVDKNRRIVGLGGLFVSSSELEGDADKADKGSSIGVSHSADLVSNCSIRSPKEVLVVG